MIYGVSKLVILAKQECQMHDKPYVIKDADGTVVSDIFYASSKEEALRMAQHFYPSAVLAELKTYGAK